MKLKDFLKYFDGLDYIILWHKDEPEEPVYEGTIFDVPFGWINYKLTLPDKDDKWDGICISKVENRKGNDVLIVQIEGE
jgi:hypothetical protein